MKYFLSAITVLIILSCNTSQPDSMGEANIIGHTETEVLQHPAWSRNSVIYEVNIRQHTPDGSFAAISKDIPRLKAMGVDILWLMPIHPIGEKNRKGKLGSYYSVRDYRGVSEEFGSAEDFRSLVKTAHDLGMKVIIDWVANHSAFDNVWTKEHREFYLPDSAGNIQPPLGTDWTDVAQLDWNNKNLWHQMREDMKYWVRDFDIDGFRCDVAMKVPTEFWNTVRASLDSIKPVFMLAEAEQKDHHLKAFDMSYTWEFMGLINDLALGKKKLADIDAYMLKQDTAFQRSAYRMYFTTNHDENSWKGTSDERYGDARFAYDVMCFTLAGMPLLYTGQEGGEINPDGTPNRYAFFEKDTVFWNNYIHQDFYSRLIKVKHENPSLWNGEYGGAFKRITTSSDDVIYAYSRTKDDNHVITILNFSDKPQKIDFLEAISGEYQSIFNAQTLSVFTKGDVKLGPWGYQVFVK